MKKQITFKKMTLLVAVLLWGMGVEAQVSLYKDGVLQGSLGQYTDIKAALGTSNANVPFVAAGTRAYVIELESNYTGEATYPLTLTAVTNASSTNTITIRPAVGAKVTIGNPNTTSIFTGVTTATTSAVITIPQTPTAQSVANVIAGMTVYGYGPHDGGAAHPTVSSVDGTAKTITCSRNMKTAESNATIYVGTPNTKTILFDGGDFITIDGVSRDAANATGLTIQNPNNIQASTIWFQNGSANNKIQNCFIKGANVSGMAFNNGGCGQIMFYNGHNDFNTITNNDICDIDGSPMPICMVLMAYDSNSTNNDNTISENNMYNIGNGTSPNGNTSFVNFSSTSNSTSFNNYILNNRMYWTKTAVFRTNPYMIGMGGSYNGLGNRIEGNVIGWQADGTTRAEITAPLNTSLTFYGSNVKNCTFKNNVIGGINYASRNFVGFQIFGHNTSTPNADDVCYGNEVRDITINSSTTTGDSRIWAILLSGTSPFDFNVKNNIIKNLVVTSTTAYPCYILGIDYTYATTGNKVSYIGNQIYNLTAGTTSSTKLNKIWGLRTGVFATTVEKNLIYDLFPLNDNTTTTEAYGVFTNNAGIVSWSTGSKSVNAYCYWGNNVYKCTTAGTATTGNAPIVTSGTQTDGTLVWTFQYTTTPNITFKNNILRLGVNNAANNKTNTLMYGIYQNAQFSTNDVNKFYHNSIYIGGTAAASATQNSYAFYQAGAVVPNTLDLKNNIFANRRINDSGTTGKHYAIGYATAGVIKTSDNNSYWASPLALAGSTAKPSLTDASNPWRGALYTSPANNDAASIEGTPNFMDAAATIPDLRIKANTTVVDNLGADLSATVTDDYDGKTRSSFTPHDIGAFAYTYSASASFATDHFRTLASGNWRTNATWQSSTDGSTNWITATAFPSASAGSVTIQNGHTVTAAAEATASTLTIDGGGKLTLSDRVGLTATALNLESHGTNGTATFVDGNATGGLTVSGTTTMKQNLTTGRNWYISNPVAATTLPTVASGTRTLHKYDESIVSDAAGATGWVANPASVEVGKGYVASVSVTGDLTFTGALNTGNKDITLTSRTGTTNKAGFNLVGNPYPSYLDWDAVMAANADKLRSSTMWYRTKINDEYSFWTVNGDGVGVPNGASVKIPPMQSFWVRAIEGGSTLNLTNAMRSHAPETDKLLKAPAAKNTDRTLVRLQVSNGINSDETVIYFSEKAKDGFDSNDAPKMSNGNAAIPEIFTTLDNEKIVINSMNTMPLNQEIKLGFVAGNASTFSLKANEITNLPENVKVILKDNAANIEADLSDGITTYAFEPIATQNDRFSLIFRTAGSTTDVQKPKVAAAQVFVNGNNQITIIAPEKSSYAIYNAMGQLMDNGKLNAELQTVNCKLQTGIYVVKVGNQSNRVILK